MIKEAIQYKRRVKKRVSEEFQDIKQKAYKILWNNDNNGDEHIFDLLDGKILIIMIDDEISFDNKKTFINRREEKKISQEFDRVEEKVVNTMIREIEDRVNKNLEEEKEKEEPSLENMLSDMVDELPLDDLMMLTDTASAFNTLKIIDEQIEILREIGGDKKKLFELLEEKRALMVNLDKSVSSLKNSITKHLK